MEKINEKKYLDFLYWICDNKYVIKPNEFENIINNYIKYLNFKSIDSIISLFKDLQIVICCSYALQWHKLLDRDIKDIDICISIESFDILNKKYGNKLISKDISSGSIKINGIMVDCYGLTIDNHIFDLFIYPDYDFKKLYSNSIILNTDSKIRMDTISNIIKAKKSYLADNYVDDYNKHIEDLNYIKEKMGF